MDDPAKYLKTPDLGEMLGLPSEELGGSQPRGDLLDYYFGPTGIPDRLRAANEMLNPLVAIQDAGSDLRQGDYVGALTNTAAALVPVAGGRMAIKTARGLPTLAPREYDEASSAISEILTGVGSPKRTGATDITRRKFLTGAAATGATAVMGPDILDLTRSAAPDIVRQGGSWDALVTRAKNILDNPVPSPFSDAAVKIPGDQLMQMQKLRDVELQELRDKVYAEALSDPEGFADTILRKTDPEDTLEKLGINRKIQQIFTRSGLDDGSLSAGVLREYPDEVAKRANVSVKDVRRYVEEMGDGYQDLSATEGYERLIDYNPDLVQKLERASVGIARDKLLEGDITEVERFVGNSPAKLTDISKDDFKLWKVLEKKRRQLADDEINLAFDFGLIDDQMAENLRKKLNELSAQSIRDMILAY